MIPQGQLDDYRRRAQQNILGRILNQPRQPMDERTPSGQSVQDLLSGVRGSDVVPRIRPQSPIADITAAPQAAQSGKPSPRIAISSQPAKGITGMLNLPEPADTSKVRPEGDAILRLPETASPTSPSVGPSIRGMGKLDRDIMLREAMGTADPESKVRVSGDQIDVSPPPMKGALAHRSRWATAGEASLNALGSADPDRPLYSLGQGLGAAVTGVVSPRAGAKINRRFDVQRLDSDIARGLKLEGAQSDLASAEALRHQREVEPILQAHKMEQEAAYRNAELELERQKAAGVIGQREYEQRRDALNRKSREGIAAQDRSSRERIAGMRGTNNGSEVRSAKAAAAQSEYDQLVKDEEEAGKQKNAAYAIVEDLKKNPVRGVMPDKMNPDYEGRLTEARRNAEEANRVYQSFGEKKRDAQRRVRENQVSTAYSSAIAAPPPPSGVTEASVRAEAKRRGQDEEAAVKKAREFGWIQ